MSDSFVNELVSRLADSSAADRTRWAERIVGEERSLESLLSLLHAEQKTAQRFMWLIGDLSDHCPDIVAPCMPLLFSLRDQMPFPGMRRSVAKWLWKTDVPKEVEKDATPQLLQWLGDDVSSIGCKSYSAKALHALAVEGRVAHDQFAKALLTQTNSTNAAFSKRMENHLTKLKQLGQ